jgi:hypothetical protein
VFKGTGDEERRSRYVELMGGELADTFEGLSYDVTLVFANWSLYEQLVADPQRVRVLDDCAGGWFGLVRSTLLLDTLLQLARLVDRSDSFGHENLTLRRLPKLLVDSSAEAEFTAEITALTEAASAACQAAVDWRNRRLAHRDLGLALASTDTPLPDISDADIRRALDLFAQLLNRLQSYFDSGATTAYGWIEAGRLDSLVFYVEKGLEAERRELGL